MANKKSKSRIGGNGWCTVANLLRLTRLKNLPTWLNKITTYYRSEKLT